MTAKTRTAVCVSGQCRTLAREVLPYYMVIPHIGRMDDIWGGYLIQKWFPGCVCYANATVYQDRNEQDLVRNLEDEVIGYRHTLDFLRDWESVLPEPSRRCYELYRAAYEKLGFTYAN